MAKKIHNEDKIRSILRKIDQQRLEIREKNTEAPEEILNPSANQIIEQLNKGECTVYFYKTTNGEHRRMKCTLVDRVPVASPFNKEGIIVVWDTDHNNWRSFYPKRVYKLIRNEQTDMQ